MGMDDLLDALIDGEHRAEGEEHDRHHEGPEEPLASEAELMLFGGVAPRASAAEQQQELVAGVGEGVHSLGEHGARHREREADELGHGDAQIGEERGEDRPLRLVGGHRATVAQWLSWESGT